MSALMNKYSFKVWGHICISFTPVYVRSTPLKLVELHRAETALRVESGLGLEIEMIPNSNTCNTSSLNFV